VTTSAFRHHDHVPPEITSPYYARLILEWVDLNASSRAASAVRNWALREPALAGCERPGDVVDRIDAAPSGGKDAILLALIRLTQGRDQLAGRVVLQAMLPKVGRLTNRTRHTDSDDAWIEDRRHIAVAQMWQVIAAYPTERRPRKVAANLALDTLHRITEGTRGARADIPLTPEAVSDLVGAVFDEIVLPGELPETPDLDAVLRWALERRVLTRDDAALIAFVYLGRGAPGSRSQEAARRLGLTPAAVRQRCSRIRGRLAAGLDSDRAQTLSR